MSVGKAIFFKQQAIYYTVSNIRYATTFMVKNIYTLHSTNELMQITLLTTKVLNNTKMSSP